MCMADNEILPASCTWVFPTMGIMQYNKNATDRAKEDVKAVLKTLNDHLLNRTFLVGERVTLADIAVACTLLNLYKQVLDPSFRKPFMNVTRWFTTVINQPNAKDVIGSFALCSKMAEFDAKKFAEFSGKGAGGDKKGTFDLEEWKRFYSNNDEDPSIAWFWEHFDHENYSIWRGDYKYNDELTMVFMSCNLIGGMFQRLEKLKKNAFASCCLFGKDNDSSISGIWVFKGQELAFELSEDWQIDYASYDWKKLDSKSDECKAQVAQYWKWEGNDAQGRPFNQGKILK